MQPFRTDDRAFTPAAGTGVLVGVVVLLLAVVGAAVFGLIDGVAPPDAEFDVDHEDGELVIVALGPDPIPAEELYVRGEDPNDEVVFGGWPADGVVHPGDRITVPEATGNEEIEIVWEPVAFARSETLARYGEDDIDTSGWDEADPLDSDPFG